MTRPDHFAQDVAEALRAATLRLQAAGCVSAEEEAVLFVDAAPDPATLDDWIRRREQGEPPAWITGTVTFCDRSVAVDPGVYVPRPQTEALARRAAAALGELPAGRQIAADLCTGSGAVAAHLKATVPDATVVGVDIDPAAVRCARRNSVPAAVGNLGDPLRSDHFGIVAAVVPYVPTDELRFLPSDVLGHEPRSALDGGDDGLAIARAAVTSAARLLRADGRLFLELGGEQSVGLLAHLSSQGFDEIDPWYDADNDLRGIAARRRALGV